MKKIRKGLSIFMALSFFACGAAACGSPKEEESKLQGKLYNGEVVDLTPSIYQEYLSLTDENAIAKLLFEYNNRGRFRTVIPSQNVTFSWQSTVQGMARYTLKVSDREDLANEIYSVTTDDFCCEVEDLLPGTYYWTVIDNYGNQTKVDSFTVGDYVRSLNVDGIKNFRDLGGWKTESGKKLKYGLTYRCGTLKESNAKALAELGVRTEIDLRADEQYKVSVLPQSYGIGFLQAGIMQGDYVLKDKSFYSSLTPEQIEEKRHSAAFKQEYADALYDAFKLYTDESNYPILFHCTSGADRTGTFAFLLEGMLGVEIDDLYRDFELTTFSMGGKRWRSNIESDGNGGYYFNDDGYVTVSDNYVAIGLLYKGLMECYSTGDGKLSSAIKNYLKTDVGLTDEDLQAIERIMLE